MMRLLIVSDAWLPQVNGVVRTLQAVTAELAAMDHSVTLVTADQFPSIACPTYPEIRLALVGAGQLERRIDLLRPDALHIATEGPLGFAARRACLRRRHAFTTAYHTQFPEYLSRRTGLPASVFWPAIRQFHRPASAVLVSSRSIEHMLNRRGIVRTRRWGRGVDLDCFRPQVEPHPRLTGLPRPILLYVGRVAVEKNVEAFLSGRHPGSRIVVGDGPELPRLKARYPHASFLGTLHGDALASAYAAADVLVFPSRTDTFGLVMVEALACGTPVAAFPVHGPLDVLRSDVACLADDLDVAIAGALRLDRSRCADFGGTFSWPASARQFLAALVPIARPGRSTDAPWERAVA
jgi:glycosyltransferase involved in cell wall biosynthesis